MPMMASTDDCVLVVVDIQERLLDAMPKGVRERVTEQVGILATAADKLGVPVMVTEQYPKGLGNTDPALKAVLPNLRYSFEKTNFSCARAEGFMDTLQSLDRKQVVLTGMESHICILQTALDLHERGYQVFVVEDAVSSRSKGNQYNALQRMRLAGVMISNTESVLFEWLEDAKHPEFKTLAKLIM